MENSKIKIMIVDDEVEILQSLKTNFELEGYEVETTSSAHEALEWIKQKRFDVIFTDINMPNMDGIELLELIKKNAGFTLIVMITAYTNSIKVLSSFENGAFDYILKPFRNFDDINNVLKRAHDHLDRWEKVIIEVKQARGQAKS